MTSDSENHREEGVRKLAEPAGAAIRPDARREANHGLSALNSALRMARFSGIHAGSSA